MANSDSSVPSSSIGQSPFADPMNPFFLHHADNPGMILVSQPLNGDNYIAWSRSMLIALSAKNKLGFITGAITQPADDDPNLLSAWIRSNSIVISWILNSVSKEISASIIFSDSAADIWNDLRDRFQQSNGPRVFQLRRDLVNLRQHQDSVSIYFTKLKTLWEELGNYRPICTCGKCSCGGVKNIQEYVQNEYVMSFLMGLNDSFAHVRAQILLLDPLPPINKVFSLILQEERQRTIGVSPIAIADSSNNMAFQVKANRHSHHAPNNNMSGSHKGQKKERPFYTECQIHGHTIDKCYKIHGYPPGYRQPQRPTNNGSPTAVNQVSVNSSTTGAPVSTNDQLGNFFQTLSSVQCQQLMSLISQHVPSTSQISHQDSSPTPFQTGYQPSSDDWQG